MKLQYSLAAAGLLLFSSVSLMGETAQEQAKRRVSPVAVAMDVNGSVRCKGFRAGETYEIKWQMLGYDSNYTTKMVIFDCGPYYNDGTCGISYAASKAFGNVLYEAELTPTNIAVADWTYKDENNLTVHANDVNYSVKFVFPTSRSAAFGGSWNTEANANPLVFRWYQIANGEPVGVPYISLLLGTEAGYHYGNNARRIESNVSTDVNASYVCPVPPAP